MDVISWAILVALAIALVAMFAPRALGWASWPRWPRASRMRLQPRQVDLSQVFDVVGPRRCARAAEVLELLAEEDSPTIAATWTRLEGPLLEAMPDCPPELKVRLGELLTACAERCSARSSARGMMALRNALLADPPR